VRGGLAQAIPAEREAVRDCSSVFYGEYTTSVDDKGRVIVPAKLRQAASDAAEGEGFVITFGEDGCVTLYTPKRWKELEAQVNKAPQGSKRTRRRRRFLYSQAEASECDRQGRLRIPARLLAKAKIEREAVVVGVSNQIELWDKAQWEAFKDEMMLERERDAELYPL